MLKQNIVEFSTLPSKCAYLENHFVRMKYKYIKNCSFELNDHLVKRGYRRFGEYFSYPQCENCDECKSVRIDAENFNFSKSVRRIFKKNQNTQVFFRRPSVSVEHLDIFNRYHAYKQEKNGWKSLNFNPQNYIDFYVKGFGDFGLEFLYFHDEKLVGVDLVDELSDGLSSIYFYYDPNYLHLNLGKFSIYQQILYALHKAKRWIYLGYYVKNCQSLSYKADFKPLQVLKKDHLNAIWEDL